MISDVFGTEPRNEISRLRYIDWDDKFIHEKPYVAYGDGQENSPSTNFTYEPRREEIIRDIRSTDTTFNLDDHGFAMRDHKLTSTGFDKDTVEEKYLPSIHQFLRQEFGPEAECLIFDWRVGRRVRCGRATSLTISASIEQ